MKTDIFMLLAASALVLFSCAKEKSPAPEQDAPMRFAVTVEGDTKASMTSADLGQFYLKVTGPNNAFSFFDTIVKEGETWKASSKHLLWKDEESSITYAAASYGALGADYFNIPVTNDLFTSGATMGLLTDQGSQEKLNAADLLTMKETTLAFADTDDGIVPVTLKHGLAKVNFKLTLAAEYKDNGIGLEENPISGVILHGVSTSFNFKPLTGEVIPQNAPIGAVVPFASTYDNTAALATFEAILVPETLAAGALTLYFTVAGKDFTWTNSTPLTFEQGGEYTIPVSVACDAAPAPTAYTLAESTVGMIVGTDGKAYAASDKDNLPSGVTAVAMVACKSGSNGLAIQLNGNPVEKEWDEAKTYAEGLSAVTGGTWRLPSKADWQNMLVGCAVSGDASASDEMNPIAGFKAKIAATGITWKSVYYWSSTESEMGAWSVLVSLGDSNAAAYFDFHSTSSELNVLGCLAF